MYRNLEEISECQSNSENSIISLQINKASDFMKIKPGSSKKKRLGDCLLEGLEKEIEYNEEIGLTEQLKIHPKNKKDMKK